MMERDAPDLPMRDCNAASGGGAGTWNVVTAAAAGTVAAAFAA